MYLLPSKNPLGSQVSQDALRTLMMVATYSLCGELSFALELLLSFMLKYARAQVFISVASCTVTMMLWITSGATAATAATAVADCLADKRFNPRVN